MKKRTSNLSILYIESDVSLQEEVSNHLKKIFSNVILEKDGKEALLQYKKHNPDIVLTDLNFQNINSFEMVVEMQDTNPDASIIVLSDRNDDFELLETLDLGLSALLEKPLNFNSLNKALQKIILQKPNKIKKNPIKSEAIKKIEKPTIQKTIVKEVKKKAIKPVEKAEPIILQKKIEESQIQIKKIESKEKIKTPKNKIIKENSIKTPKIDYTLCDEIITDALNNKSDVLCTNSYKGLIINNNSKIIEFEHGLIMLQVTKTQMFSIVYEKKVTLHINDKYILAKLLKINKDEGQIILKEPVLLNFKPRDKTNKRLNVDSSFKVTMGFNNLHKELNAIEVSEHYVILESNTALNIKRNSMVELTMGFEIDAPSTMIMDKKFIKVFAKGTIQRVDLLENKQRIVIEHKIQTTGINVYKQYLQQREISIITEFKSKMKNKL